MLKAFGISFRVSVHKKEMLGCESSKEFDRRQRSAWLWKAKIQEAIKSGGKHELTGNVGVDEFITGGFLDGEPGRSHGSKDMAVLAMEKAIDKKGRTTIGRAYCRVIDDASADSFKNI